MSVDGLADFAMYEDTIVNADGFFELLLAIAATRFSFAYSAGYTALALFLKRRLLYIIPRF